MGSNQQRQDAAKSEHGAEFRQTRKHETEREPEICGSQSAFAESKRERELLLCAKITERVLLFYAKKRERVLMLFQQPNFRAPCHMSTSGLISVVLKIQIGLISTVKR